MISSSPRSCTLSERFWAEWVKEASTSSRAKVEVKPLAEFLHADFIPAVIAVEQPDPAATEISHFGRWAGLVEAMPYVGLVAFRASLKSVFAKGVIAHDLTMHQRGLYEGRYFSATQQLAGEHLMKLKLYIADLAEEWGWRDATSGKTFIHYTQAGASFLVTPHGVDGRTRGRRANRIVLDDLLDPIKPISMADVQRVLEAVKRRILPLLKNKTSSVLFCGTPIVEGDAVSWVASHPSFHVDWMPILDAQGQPTWEKFYGFDRIEQLKKLHGDRAFEIEFMLKQTNMVDSFISPELLARQTVSWEELGCSKSAPQTNS